MPAASQTDCGGGRASGAPADVVSAVGIDPRRRHDDEVEAFDVLQQIVDVENAVAFLGAAFADA